METLISIFPTTEEILSSSPIDRVSNIAVSAAIPLRCAARFVAEGLGANGLAVEPALNAR